MDNLTYVAVRQKKPQVNFQLEPVEFDAFLRWCRDRGLDKKMVFFAGWRALAAMAANDRDEFFRGLDEWLVEVEQKGAPADPVQERAGPEHPTHGSLPGGQSPTRLAGENEPVKRKMKAS